MKKKRKSIIILSVCSAVLIVLIIVGIWQRNNIEAVWIALTKDSESVDQMKADQEQHRQDVLSQYGLQAPPAPGTVTPSDTSNDPAVSDAPDVTPDPDGTDNTGNEVGNGTAGNPDGNSPASEEPSSDDVIQQCVNELYAIEASYMGQVDSVVASIKAEFDALPSEQKTDSTKAAMISSGTSTLLSIESQCDAAVEAQLAVISEELAAQGKDNGLVQEIRALYRESKTTWKASIITQLKK